MGHPAKVCGQPPLSTASPSQEGTLGAWSLTHEQKQTGAVLCSDPRTFWAGFLELGVEVGVCVCCWQDTPQAVHTTTGEPGWRAPPSCLPGHWLLLKAGISDPLPTPQGDRQQDVKTPGTQCSSHQPVSAACTNGSMSPAQAA